MRKSADGAAGAARTGEEGRTAEKGPGGRAEAEAPDAEPVSVPSPEDYLGYRVVRLSQALQQRFKDALAPSGLSPRQFSVLAVLAERPEITTAELARAVLTTPQSMGALVEGLEGRGLVARTGPGPRRRGVAAPLAPTTAGMAALATAGPSVAALEDEVFAGLPAVPLAAFREVLAALEERLG